MDNDELIFANEDNEQSKELEQASESFWSILIVDDDPEVHAVTKLALHDFSFDNKKLKFFSAYSAKEAKNILSENSNFVIVLLDIVMESNNAGLKVVNYIRQDLNDSLMRVIIRTGQPGYAPERDIINHYDINDYKEKTELTTTKLYTTTRTALSQFKQLSELKNKKNEIYEYMIKDKITNLYSRAKLYEDLKSLKNIGLLLIDIDSFNTFNNAYGYDVGDKILNKIANILKITIYETDLIYRIESDNFILLFQDKSDIFLKNVATKIKENIDEQPFEIDDLTIMINISIGIVNYPNDNLLQKSEMAINASREKMDDKIELYSEKLKSIKEINNNLFWSKRLTKAINSNNILTYFQPIVDCKTNTIVKYETLVRLSYEDEIYSPFHFLGAARNAGLLTKITKIVFEQACQKFSDNNYDFSVNITNHDLMKKEFTNTLLEYCKKYYIEPSRVSIEVLEEASINKNIQARKTLNDLKDNGFLLSVDDFGIEYSNFSRLKDLDADNIKIDGSFIQDILTNQNSLYIVKSILAYTKSINIKTIAEFVHSQEVYDKVKELGVDYVQGYHLGMPKSELV